MDNEDDWDLRRVAPVSITRTTVYASDLIPFQRVKWFTVVLYVHSGVLGCPHYWKEHRTDFRTYKDEPAQLPAPLTFCPFRTSFQTTTPWQNPRCLKCCSAQQKRNWHCTRKTKFAQSRCLVRRVAIRVARRDWDLYSSTRSVDLFHQGHAQI